MRKVILFMHVSLDGFVCGPNGEQDWMTMNDPALDRYMIADLLATVDTMLVGRVLYQGFASFWPELPKNPSNPKDLIEFANWMEQTPKVVFSKTLTTVDWANSILADGDPGAVVKKLRQKPGGDMVIFGGAGIVAHFTKFNLVDEYRIKLEPVILGRGRPLFSETNERVKLTLRQAKPFESGVVAMYYSVDRK